jgi:hypothetical protein
MIPLAMFRTRSLRKINMFICLHCAQQNGKKKIFQHFFRAKFLLSFSHTRLLFFFFSVRFHSQGGLLQRRRRQPARKGVERLRLKITRSLLFYIFFGVALSFFSAMMIMAPSECTTKNELKFFFYISPVSHPIIFELSERKACVARSLSSFLFFLFISPLKECLNFLGALSHSHSLAVSVPKKNEKKNIRKSFLKARNQISSE